MTTKVFTLALYVSLAVLCVPLACGDDPASPNGGDADSGGFGGEATGGNAHGGSMAGQGSGETGGHAAGGSGNVGATGGGATGGTSVGGAGGAPGGEAGMSGTGTAGQGGVGGTSDGGAGGEGGVDEETARCERICTKVDHLMCESWSDCVEYYCDVIAHLYYPYCRPYAVALVKCLDERATADEFSCWVGHVGFEYIPGESSCAPEMEAAMDVGCL